MNAWSTALEKAIDESQWATVADILLREAHAATLPLGEDEKARRQAFNTVIAQQCQAGGYAAALRTAEATTDYHRIECLKAIARAQAGPGTALDSLLALQVETARQLTEAAEALVEIAEVVARQGGSEAAASLLAWAASQGWPSAPAELRPHGLAPLAVGYARLGRFDSARELLADFAQAADETWVEVAREQIRQGHTAAADTTVGLIQNPSRQRQARMEMALRTHDMEQARTIARDAEEARSRETRLAQAYPELDTILARLSREYLEAGRVDDARKFIEDIQRPQLRAMEMAQAQVEAGQVDEALQLTEGMDGTSARDYALLAAVTKKSAAGDAVGALELVGGINKVETRDRARALVVDAYCRAGDFEAAFNIFHSIQNEKNLAVPLGILVSALFQSDRAKAALKLMSQVPKGLLSGLEPVLKVLLQRTDRASLQQILPRCTESLAPAWRFCTVLAEVHPADVDALAAVLVRY